VTRHSRASETNKVKVPRFSILNNRLFGTLGNCGFDLTNHHHASEGAEACTAIAVSIL